MNYANSCTGFAFDRLVFVKSFLINPKTCFSVLRLCSVSQLHRGPVRLEETQPIVSAQHISQSDNCHSLLAMRSVSSQECCFLHVLRSSNSSGSSCCCHTFGVTQFWAVRARQAFGLCPRQFRHISAIAPRCCCGAEDNACACCNLEIE